MSEKPTLAQFRPAVFTGKFENHNSVYTRPRFECTAQSFEHAKTCSGHADPIGDACVWCLHDNFGDMCHHHSVREVTK